MTKSIEFYFDFSSPYSYIGYKEIKQLEKKYTLGKVNFNSVVIADFDESLKSVATSLLYTDISPKKNILYLLINGSMKA